MKRSTEQHIFITGACGAGKSTLGKVLSRQLQLPLHRLDDDPDFRQMLQHEPDLNRFTDPQRYAQWQALRRHLVHEAVKLHQPHIIEGTHILAAPELTTGHRRILVDTPLHQIIRQNLARDRAKYAADPARYAERHAGTPGSAAARQRALRARQIYEGLRAELDAFRQLPGVEIVPSRVFNTWLPQQVPTSADLYAMMESRMHTPQSTRQGGDGVDFVAVMDQVIALLRQRGRLTYRTLQRQFQLDEVALEDLKEELIYGQRLALDEDGRVLVWTGATGPTAPAAAAPTGTSALTPLTYTPPYLAEKIFMSRSALEGERKQVTVLFADLKDSTELIRGLDPEAAQQLLDPALHLMMDAVHRFEGTVNQVLGDGIMALFGAPVAHEDHAVRACYAALAMQDALRRYSAELRRRHGVGKSRLVYEFVHAHHTRAWLVLESASVSYGKATPYFPVIDLLKRYTHVEDHDATRTIRAKVTGQVLTLDETLHGAIPALLSLLEALPEDSPFLALDPPQRRRQTLEALKRVFVRESQVQPLLLIFEVLHWIDTETQAWLDSLVESLPTARLLLLVNYRPEYQHGWGSKTYYTQLRLDPLPPANAEVFLQALLGDDASLAPLKQLLIARTQGNPLFLEESVRTLVETKALIGERGAYRLAQDPRTIQVPATVQAILAARIDRLSPEDKRLLQAASVVGKDVPFTLLQAIAELPDEVLRQSLARLQTAEFLYEVRLFPDLEYTFKHALTHEVAYGSVLQERRRALHARIVETLERLYENRLDEHVEALAHHAFLGEVWAKAVRYLRHAGARACRGSANREAVTLLERALAALRRLPDSASRAADDIDVRLELRLALLPL